MFLVVCHNQAMVAGFVRCLLRHLQVVVRVTEGDALLQDIADFGRLHTLFRRTGLAIDVSRRHDSDDLVAVDDRKKGDPYVAHADIGLTQVLVDVHDFIGRVHQILDERQRLHFGWFSFAFGHLAVIFFFFAPPFVFHLDA